MAFLLCFNFYGQQSRARTGGRRMGGRGRVIGIFSTFVAIFSVFPGSCTWITPHIHTHTHACRTSSVHRPMEDAGISYTHSHSNAL